MEKFKNLPKEKQDTIINAALKIFGSNGYKKASVSDIASAAGISKAMVFHYFGTKKAFYLYLIELCGNIVVSEVINRFDNTVTDFFDRIKMSTEIELSVMKQYPAIPTFLTSMYFEADEEVKDDIKAIIAQGDGFREKIAFEGIDMSKFKESVDLKVVMKMLTWMTDGFMNQFSGKTDVDFEDICNEFYDCMNMLRKNFYKEEYL
ncbi:TetR/AcrR family transcriptional regulator [Clostridium folliculivorans]|uniref:TetR family transcriptional regulator n=1 Tax=Clostridium folliculivorans TaxID=2886038 RepID=A0A9W5XZW6_9CLOT|nr:TetR/AcrR family transcriptional regulator [Clostridium folliculivorans]GKU24159.1 TetR family transcriptional regulator [Clostridium folliculivorans]GKU30264.1 TetR family transcriptional regulator [Clostridium folliculivorans]